MAMLAFTRKTLGSSTVRRTFTPVIPFDVPSLAMETTQTADITLTLDTTLPSVPNADTTVLIRTDGTHLISVSGEFQVIGALTAAAYCDLILTFRRVASDLQPACYVTPLPKGGVPGGATSAGGQVPVTTLAAPVVGTLTATASTFTIPWTNVAGNRGYQVRYSKDSTFATGTTVLMLGQGVLQYTATGLASGDTYYAQVRTLGPTSATNSGYSAAKSILVSGGGTTQLARPTGVQLVPTSTFAQASCQAVPNATQYEFDLATDSAFTQNLVQVVSNTNSATFTGLTPDGVTYYLRVQAQAVNYTASLFSATVSAITQLGNDPTYHIYNFSPDNATDGRQIITLNNSVGLFSGFNPFCVLFNAKVNAGGKLQLSQGTDAKRGMDIILEAGQIGVTLMDTAGNYLYYYVAVAIDTAANWEVQWDGNSNPDSVQIMRNGELKTITASPSAGVFQGIDATYGVRLGAVVSDRSVNSFLDDLYIIDGTLTQAQFAEVYPVRQRNQLSFAARIKTYMRFENKLVDETGLHSGTATTPLYVTSI